MINIVCALSCEARPLIVGLNLKRDSESEIFPLYVGDDVRLILSGVGKLASAAATGYLFSRCEKRSAAWLNVVLLLNLPMAKARGF